MISPAPAFHTFCIRNTSAPPIPPPTKPNMLPATVLFGLRRGQSFFLPKSLPPKSASVSPISGIANAHSRATLLLSASAPYSHSIATAAKRLIGYTSTNMDAIVSCAVRASVNILSAMAISMHAIATIQSPMPPNTLYAAKYSSANIYAGSMNGFSSFLASALPISYAAITAPAVNSAHSTHPPKYSAAASTAISTAATPMRFTSFIFHPIRHTAGSCAQIRQARQYSIRR